MIVWRESAGETKICFSFHTKLCGKQNQTCVKMMVCNIKQKKFFFFTSILNLEKCRSVTTFHTYAQSIQMFLSPNYNSNNLKKQLLYSQPLSSTMLKVH